MTVRTQRRNDHRLGGPRVYIMSDTIRSYPDPLIDEVRRRRRELFADYDNDPQKLFEAIQRIQTQHPEKVIDPRLSESRARERQFGPGRGAPESL